MTNNIREKSNFIWQVADDTLCVRGTFKAHEYGDVILPFVLLRRLDLVLEPQKDAVIKQFELFKGSLDEERPTPILRQAGSTSITTPYMTCAGWPRIRRILSSISTNT
jgi:type I restriction enzyme M protein